MTRMRGLFPLQKPRFLKACRLMLDGFGHDSSLATHALQHKLGGIQRIGEQSRLFGDTPGIDAGESDAGDDGHPHARDIDERHVELGAGIPR